MIALLNLLVENQIYTICYDKLQKINLHVIDIMRNRSIDR